MPVEARHGVNRRLLCRGSNPAQASYHEQHDYKFPTKYARNAGMNISKRNMRLVINRAPSSTGHRLNHWREDRFKTRQFQVK
jgi:hypothetical protein